MRAGAALLALGLLGCHSHREPQGGLGLRGEPNAPRRADPPNSLEVAGTPIGETASGAIVYAEGAVPTSERSTTTPSNPASGRPKQIQSVIRSHLGEVRACYERALMQQQKLEGRVMVRFTLGSDGIVTDSRVSSSTFGNPTMEGCIAAAVATWHFDAAPGHGPTIVNYPFVLKTQP